MPVEQGVKPFAVIMLDKVTQLMEHDVFDAMTRRANKRGIEVDHTFG